MSDDRSKPQDDAWLDALQGRETKGGEEGRIIRASLEARQELTSERIADADLEAAKQRLLERLGNDGGGDSRRTTETAEGAKVVDLSARRPRAQRRSVWRQNPATLLVASVAFVAIVMMLLRNPDIPNGPAVIMSYGEIDVMRGAVEENLYPVEDPDAFGRELAAALIEREIPFALTTETPDSADRIITIQVDGVVNEVGVRDTLDQLGLDRPPGSVVVVRLVPERR